MNREAPRLASAPRVLVAQIGARRHYAVPRALHAHGALARLVTDACAELPPWRQLAQAWPAPLQPVALRRILDRRLPEVPRCMVHGLPYFALSALWQRPRPGRPHSAQWARRNASFARAVARGHLGAVDCVYGFNAAALELFEAARARGLRVVLDQTAAPWRWNTRLLQSEAETWPGWERPLAEIDEQGLLAQREEAEWRLADAVVCGSRFALRALTESGGPAERSQVVPYPTPEQSSSTLLPTRLPFDGRRALRVLFVGTLQLRKGIQYLCAAAEALPRAQFEFRAVGPSLLCPAAHRRVARVIDCVGAVRRAQMPVHYAWADVLVLPTLSEGSANVVYEARAAGLPVIATEAAGVEFSGDAGLLEVRRADVDDLLRRLQGLRSAWLQGAGAPGVGERARRRCWDYGRDLVSICLPDVVERAPRDPARSRQA